MLATFNRHPWLLCALISALAAAAICGPALLSPLSLAMGQESSEGPVHLWTLWAASEGLLRHGPLVVIDTVNHPAGFARHLMDPIDLLLFSPLYLLGGGGLSGAVLGWNGLHLGVVLLGGLSAWALSRRVLPSRDAEVGWLCAGVLCVSVVCNSAIVGQPFTGRTEYLAALLYPGHLALLHRWLVDREPGRRAGVAAGLSLGAVALGGWYLAIFVAIGDVLLAGAWSWPRRSWRQLARLGVVAGIAAAMLLPAALALWWYPPPGLEEEAKTAGVHALGMHFRRVAIHASALKLDQPMYLGVVPMGLGVIGLLGDRRRAWPWVLAATALGVLGLGRVVITGPGSALVRYSMPAGWLTDLIPALTAIKSWSRIGIVAAVPVAAAAALGARVVLRQLSDVRQRVVLGLILIAAIAADLWTWPRSDAWQRPAFSPAPPADVLTVLSGGEGAILVLPLVPPVPGHKKSHQPMRLLWHLQYGRPVSSTPNKRPAVVDESWIASSIAAFQMANTRKSGVPTVTAADAACAAADVGVLTALGFTTILVDGEGYGADEVTGWLEEALGPPTRTAGLAATWELAGRDGGGTPCPPVEIGW